MKIQFRNFWKLEMFFVLPTAIVCWDEEDNGKGVIIAWLAWAIGIGAVEFSE